MYLAGKDIKRYIDNEDSSSISFRMFKESPRDKYPVTTLCFFGRSNEHGNILGDTAIYKKQELKKKGFSVSKFWKIMAGKINVSAGEIERLPDFSAMTINLKKLTRIYQTIDGNGMNFKSLLSIFQHTILHHSCKVVHNSTNLC